MGINIPNAVRFEVTYFIGVDLGQRGSHTAFVVLERFDEQPDFTDVLRGQGMRRRYIVRQAERVALGTPYNEVIQRLNQIVGRLSPRGLCVVVVDESGGGVPVVESMRRELVGCRIVPIMITSGQTASGTSVPRAMLITKMQVMAERDELEIASGCRDGEALVRELAHLTLDRNRDGERDDLAMALSLASWRAKVR